LWLAGAVALKALDGAKIYKSLIPR
jgi:hypothetical protein